MLQLAPVTTRPIPAQPRSRAVQQHCTCQQMMATSDPVSDSVLATHQDTHSARTAVRHCLCALHRRPAVPAARSAAARRKRQRKPADAASSTTTAVAGWPVRELCTPLRRGSVSGRTCASPSVRASPLLPRPCLCHPYSYLPVTFSISPLRSRQQSAIAGRALTSTLRTASMGLWRRPHPRVTLCVAQSCSRLRPHNSRSCSRPNPHRSLPVHVCAAPGSAPNQGHPAWRHPGQPRGPHTRAGGPAPGPEAPPAIAAAT